MKPVKRVSSKKDKLLLRRTASFLVDHKDSTTTTTVTTGATGATATRHGANTPEPKPSSRSSSPVNNESTMIRDSMRLDVDSFVKVLTDRALYEEFKALAM
ncbi:hypothetical protein HK102_012713, partial [Quaeritorhiza haematococci]